MITAFGAVYVDFARRESKADLKPYELPAAKRTANEINKSLLKPISSASENYQNYRDALLSHERLDCCSRRICVNSSRLRAMASGGCNQLEGTTIHSGHSV